MIATSATHAVDVGHGHRLHVEEAGYPSGTPVVWLHGGPGSGCSAQQRELFDGALHRAVLVDQRGAGRSTPWAADEGVHWASIDLEHHVADLEAVRTRLRIERWIVAGASWGSVLGTAYAQRHPQRVSGAVLAAVSTGTRQEIDHLTEHGHRYHPEAWQRFHDFVPGSLRDRRLVDAYHELVMDPEPAVHQPAAEAWCRWEDAHVDVDRLQSVDGFVQARYQDPRFRLAFARQVTHCWVHDSWLGPDELVRGAGALHDVPCHLVHGARDVSSPLEPATRLHHAWLGSELTVVDDEGHGGRAMWGHVARALRELSSRPPR